MAGHGGRDRGGWVDGWRHVLAVESTGHRDGLV